MNNLAIVLIDLDRHAEAEPLMRKLIAAIESLQGPEARPLIIALATLEQLVFRRGDETEERSLNRRRFEMAMAAFEGDHPWKATALIDHGWLLSRDGDWKQGEAQIQQGIEINQRLGGRDMGAVSGWRRLALSQQNRGDPDAASASYARAIELCQRSAAIPGAMCIAARANRAHLWAGSEKAAAALSETDELLQILDQPNSAGFDERAQVLEARAAALAALGRQADALRTQQQAVDLFEANYGPSHRSTEAAKRRAQKLGLSKSA